MKQTAYLIPADGSEIRKVEGEWYGDTLDPIYELVCPGNRPIAQRVSLRNLNDYVGDLWMDEEGIMNERPVNPVATGIAFAARAIFAGDCILGDALVTPPMGVSEPQDWILRFLEAEQRIVKAAAGL